MSILRTVLAIALVGLAPLVARAEVSELRIPLAALPALPEGSYYHHELRGLDVRVETGESIGSVHDLWETGATPVLMIRDAAGKETLLPMVDAFVLEVNVKSGYMRVKAAGTVSS